MSNYFNENSSKDNTQRQHHRNNRTESNKRLESAIAEEPQLVETEKKQPPNSLSARSEALLPVPVELKNSTEERRKRNEQLSQRRPPSCGQEVEQRVQFGVKPYRDKNNLVPSRNQIPPKIRDKNRETTKNVVTTVSNNRVETEVIESKNPSTKKTVVITLENSTNIEQINVVMNFNKQSNEQTCPQALNNETRRETTTNNNYQIANANKVSTEATNNEYQVTDISNVSTEDKGNENVSLPTDIVTDIKEEGMVSINSKKKDNTLDTFTNLKRRLYEYSVESKKLQKTTDCLSTNSTNTQCTSTTEMKHDSNQNDTSSNTTKPRGLFVTVRNNSDGTSEVNFLRYEKPTENDSEREGSPGVEIPLKMLGRRITSSEHTENPTHAEYRERIPSNKHNKNYAAKYPKMRTEPISDTKPILSSTEHPNSSNTENPKGLGEPGFSNQPTKSSGTALHPKMLGETVSRSKPIITPAQQKRMKMMEEYIFSGKNSGNTENPKELQEPVCSNKSKIPSAAKYLKVLGETISRSKLTPAQDKRLKMMEDRSLPSKFIENSESTVNPKMLEEPACFTEPTKSSSNTEYPNPRSNTMVTLTQETPLKIKEEPEFFSEFTENSSNTENPKVFEESVCSNVPTKNPSYTKHPKMFGEPTSNQSTSNRTYEDYLKMLERYTFSSKHTEYYDNAEKLKVLGKSDCSKEHTESRSSTGHPKVFRDTTYQLITNPTQENYHTNIPKVVGEPVSYNKPVKNYTYEEYLKILKARALSSTRTENSSAAKCTKELRKRVSSNNSDKNDNAEYQRILTENVSSSKHSTHSEDSFQQSNRAKKSFSNILNFPEVQRTVKTCKDSGVSTLAKLHTEKNNDKKNPNEQEDLSDTDSQ